MGQMLTESWSKTLERLRGAAHGGLRRLTTKQRFRGAFASRAEALAAVRADRVGYDHAEVAPISFEPMCQVAAWDYPVLFWLKALEPQIGGLIDAGGHMGTKFRAFTPKLGWGEAIPWAVYDLPAIVAAGAARAKADGLRGLSFHADPSSLPQSANLLLASGLLQYLDTPFADLVARLPRRPKHIILNKVAAHGGPPAFTLENFGVSEIVYQVRNRATFEAELAAMGYDILDRWPIPALSHRLSGDVGRVRSESFGYALRDITGPRDA